MKPAGDNTYTCLKCGFTDNDILFLACEECPVCGQPFTPKMFIKNRQNKLSRQCNRCLSETNTLPCSVCGGRTFSYTEVIDKSKLLEELDKLVRETDGHDLKWEGYNECLREVRRIVERMK